MFQRPSRDAYYCLDLHSAAGDDGAAVEVLLPDDSVAATELYLAVIKETLGEV